MPATPTAAMANLSLGAWWPCPPSTWRGTTSGARPAAIAARRDSGFLIESFESIRAVSFSRRCSILHEIDPHQGSLRGEPDGGSRIVALRCAAEHGPFPRAVLVGPLLDFEELGRGVVRTLRRPPLDRRIEAHDEELEIG